MQVVGTLEFETDADVRNILRTRYLRRSLVVALCLLALGISASSCERIDGNLGRFLLWTGMAALYWALYHWNFRRIYLRALQAGSQLHPKAEVDELAKFSTLLATTGGLSIIFERQLVFGLLILINILAGIMFVDFNGELYADEIKEQDISYLRLNSRYYSELRTLVRIQEVSFIAALLGLIILKGGKP